MNVLKHERAKKNKQKKPTKHQRGPLMYSIICSSLTDAAALTLHTLVMESLTLHSWPGVSCTVIGQHLARSLSFEPALCSKEHFGNSVIILLSPAPRGSRPEFRMSAKHSRSFSALSQTAEEDGDLGENVKKKKKEAQLSSLSGSQID